MVRGKLGVFIPIAMSGGNRTLSARMVTCDGNEGAREHGARQLQAALNEAGRPFDADAAAREIATGLLARFRHQST